MYIYIYIYLFIYLFINLSKLTVTDETKASARVALADSVAGPQKCELQKNTKSEKRLQSWTKKNEMLYFMKSNH